MCCRHQSFFFLDSEYIYRIKQNCKSYFEDTIPLWKLSSCFDNLIYHLCPNQIASLELDISRHVAQMTRVGHHGPGNFPSWCVPVARWSQTFYVFVLWVGLARRSLRTFSRKARLAFGTKMFSSFFLPELWGNFQSETRFARVSQRKNITASFDFCESWIEHIF